MEAEEKVKSQETFGIKSNLRWGGICKPIIVVHILDFDMLYQIVWLKEVEESEFRKKLLKIPRVTSTDALVLLASLEICSCITSVTCSICIRGGEKKCFLGPSP